MYRCYSESHLLSSISSVSLCSGEYSGRREESRQCRGMENSLRNNVRTPAPALAGRRQNDGQRTGPALRLLFGEVNRAERLSASARRVFKQINIWACPPFAQDCQVSPHGLRGPPETQTASGRDPAGRPRSAPAPLHLRPPHPAPQLRMRRIRGCPLPLPSQTRLAPLSSEDPPPTAASPSPRRTLPLTAAAPSPRRTPAPGRSLRPAGTTVAPPPPGRGARAAPGRSRESHVAARTPDKRLVNSARPRPPPWERQPHSSQGHGTLRRQFVHKEMNSFGEGISVSPSVNPPKSGGSTRAPRDFAVPSASAGTSGAAGAERRGHAGATQPRAGSRCRGKSPSANPTSKRLVRPLRYL